MLPSPGLRGLWGEQTGGKKIVWTEVRLVNRGIGLENVKVREVWEGQMFEETLVRER